MKFFKAGVFVIGDVSCGFLGVINIDVIDVREMGILGCFGFFRKFRFILRGDIK